MQRPKYSLVHKPTQIHSLTINPPQPQSFNRPCEGPVQTLPSW